MNRTVAALSLLILLTLPGCAGTTAKDVAKALKPGELELEINGGQTFQKGQPNSYSQGGAIHLHYPLGGN